MAKKEYSLAHTKWMCKYHIVFTPKYRRKVIYNQYKADIRDIIKQLCSYKGVEIIEGHLMPDHIHMLVSMINMKLRDDDMKLVHVLSIYDLKEDEFLKRLDENDYFYDEMTNQIKTK